MGLRELESVDTKNMTNEDWLKLRNYSIGGSDAGAILGVNKYESPYSLYWKKKDPEKFKKDLSDNEFIYWGNTLEDIVAKEFAKRTGKRVRRHNKMMYHKEHRFMSANVDRVVIGEKAILEVKTASEYVKSDWADGNIPASYMAQCYHYLAVTGYEKAYIAVLIGGNKFHWDVIERDEEIIEEIVEVEKDFWHNHIIADVPPDIDDTSATTNTLNALWLDKVEDNVVNFKNDKAALFTAITAVDKEIKELKSRKQGLENKLKLELGENQEGLADGYKVTWKPQSTKRLDSKRLKEERPDLYEQYLKETKSRVLKLKELNA